MQFRNPDNYQLINDMDDPYGSNLDIFFGVVQRMYKECSFGHKSYAS
jgi:hypothetical protein